MTADIQQMLVNAAARYGVDPSLAIAVAQQESGGDPNAVSPAGAQGVMQLMPATAQDLGVTNPFDPAQNIDAGVRYLSQMLQKFNGNVQLALAAYDWGPGHVSKNGFLNWPKETMNYVTSILANAGNQISAAFSPTVPDATGDSGGGSDGSGPNLLGLVVGGLLVFLTIRLVQG